MMIMIAIKMMVMIMVFDRIDFNDDEQVLLTLTDGHLGRDNFISQSVIV